MGAEVVFVAVQGFVLLFLLLHDWVPLGPFNDLESVNSQIPFKRKVRDTAINTVPVAAAFVLTLRYLGRPYSTAVRVYLIAIYGLLLIGEFRAWWKPYLLRADPKLVQGTRPCLARRTPSCPSETESSRTQLTSCCTPALCWPFCSPCR
jgi:hypothetical protein